ncbi:MAG: ribbon-helix-helix domain-containing protein [Actinomycetota bacterium]
MRNYHLVSLPSLTGLALKGFRALYHDFRTGCRHTVQYDNSMTANKEKIAITLPPHLVKAAKKAVRAGEAPSVSAYVSQALEEKTKREDLAVLLDEMLAETGGPPTKKEQEWADRVLRGGKTSGKRKR